MAKQIYIDENGNENLVSGTINTGKMLPMSTTDPDKVADRITALESEINVGVLSAERIEITPTASGVSNYGEGSYYYQRGKLTFVHINVQGLTANSQVTIFTMPSGARPVQSVYACGFCGNSYTGVANININASGVVKVASVDTYASVYVCYMAT